MEGVVDAGLARSAPVVVLDRSRQGLALYLRGERDHGGGAAAGRRAGAGLEVVRHAHWRRHRLVHVAMPVDPARQHRPVRGVDLAPARSQPVGERHDAPAPHADVAALRVRRGDHIGITYNEIEGLAHFHRIIRARPLH